MSADVVADAYDGLFVKDLLQRRAADLLRSGLPQPAVVVAISPAIAPGVALRVGKALGFRGEFDQIDEGALAIAQHALRLHLDKEPNS